jgi:sterol 3beta-glucosyltransferase
MRIGIQTWGSDGDVRPFIALGNGLAEVGHEVTLAVASIDNKTYDAFSHKPQFTIIPGPYNSLWEERTINDAVRRLLKSRDFFGQLRVILDRFFYPLVNKLYEQALQLSEENDLLIGHFLCYPLRAAAQITHKPFVSVTLNHLGIPSRFKPPMDLPNSGSWLNAMYWTLACRIANSYFLPQVNRLYRDVGLPSVKSIFDDVFFSRELNLVATSKAFCKPLPDWEGRHVVCGFLDIGQENESWLLPPGLDGFLKSGPPPVYITLGSMVLLDPEPSAIVDTLAKAVANAHTRAIIQAPWGKLHGVDHHPDVYRAGITPHHAVFPRCSVIIHHGGAGTTHSATFSGCPSIVIQHFADQGFWGKELKKAGLALSVLDRRTITPETLSKAIRSLLDRQDIKRHAEKVGQYMRNERGVQTAVETINRRFC